MGKIILPNKTEFTFDGETGQVSDGYHTFSELYAHRIELFITLCRVLSRTYNIENDGGEYIWKSRKQSDGTKYNGWFILGISKEKGEQITYHLPISKWKECDFAEKRKQAPRYDGHTSNDVLKRLKKV